jgi:uncharacterized SAM-binding protein YcdF (DUF218 family)
MALVALRGSALFLGLFALLGAVAAGFGAGWDPNLLWIDLRPAPAAVASLVAAAAGAVLAAWALAPDAGTARRRATIAVAAVLALVAAANAVRAATLPDVRLGAPPASAFIALLLVAVAWRARKPVVEPRRVAVTCAAAAVAAVYPAALMLSFGTTDYRRPADAIVVLGARTYADGRASWSLEDRVLTACELWREGRAPVLVMSGGPGDGGVHEADAMRRLALDAGVPDDAIVLDRDGVSTRATAANAATMLLAEGRSTALVVSHAYHLPRAKVAFERRGVRAFTVPCTQRHAIPQMPWMVARELVAWWAYALRPA